ncbi:hypothetical protein SPKIRA_33420 [Sphingomonas paucimobilis]|nr:hypothetical protein SPKIRA_33420 [Sphingomonas paucimobilis]
MLHNKLMDSLEESDVIGRLDAETYAREVSNDKLARIGSAPGRGVGTPILGRAKDDQAVRTGRLMRGLSLSAPIVSSVM